HELVALAPSDPGHQGEVVILAAPGVAILPPRANIAVLARLRVGFRAVALPEKLRQACLGLLVVREVVVCPPRDGLHLLGPEGEPDLLGALPLGALQEVGIDAELQNCPRLLTPRE